MYELLLGLFLCFGDIDAMSADTFKERDGAYQRIRDRGVFAVPCLYLSLEHKDPEVRWRVRRLLAPYRIAFEQAMYRLHPPLQED